MNKSGRHKPARPDFRGEKWWNDVKAVPGLVHRINQLEADNRALEDRVLELERQLQELLQI